MLPSSFATGYTTSIFPAVNGDRSPSPAFIPSSEDFVELLRSPDFDTRLQTLNRLMTMVKRDPDWFPKFSKKGELFKSLDKILTEDRWEVQHQMIKFLMEAMPSLGANLEYCACYLMPNLLPKLGSSKVTVRRVTVQATQMFLRLVPQGLAAVLKMLTTCLLGQIDRAVRLEILNELPALYIAEQKQGNWKNLIDVLTKLILSNDKEIIERASDCLRKLQAFIGSEASNRLLAEVSDEQKMAFLENVSELQGNQGDEPDTSTLRTLAKSGERRFRYGIVPTYVETMLNDDDPSTRMAALEKLKGIIERITPEEINKFTQHLHSYFVRIGHVLEDLNFKVVVMALDLIRLTVNRLKQNIEAHLQQVVQLIARHFGNQKAVVKQIIMMTFQDLFHNLVPKKVVAMLSAYLTDKNSRVREEVINILTVAFMNSNPGRINFTAVSNMLVPMLIDPKRRVRLAAFEQLSVIAYLMDSKIEPLMRAVRDIEEKHSIVGLAHAVLARLGRHVLPKIRSDGLLEYATPPRTDNAFDVEPGQMKESENADLQWILFANSGESGDRTISPISLIDFKMKARRPKSSKPKALMPWEEAPAQETIPQFFRQKSQEPDELPAPVERMLSDDQIVRRPGSKEAIHPGESTNSWHSPGPKRNNSVAAERSTSAINRLNGNSRNELDTSLDRIRFNALQKRSELNNNTYGAHINENLQNGAAKVPAKPKVQKKISQPQNPYRPPEQTPMSFGRAKSETQLAIEDRENRHPFNNDDTPIRPAKLGVYGDDNAYPSDNFSSGLVKKSMSQHSLPAATNAHKNKKHMFLKSGGGNRVKPTPLSSNAAPIGGARHSVPSVGGGVAGALKLMNSEEWQDKVDGINQICELSSSNPSQVVAQIHEVCMALLEECKNLRSSVSRVALSAFSTLFANLKSKMDGEIEKIGAVLMNKSGDVSSAFIRDDANDAIEKMITYGSPIKVLSVLINSGSKAKSNTIRASCSQFVSQLVQRVGVSNTLNSTDFLAKLIPILVNFARDQTPNVRQHAKSTLISLSDAHNFDAQLKKACMDSDVRAVKEIISHIHKKGGADGLDSTSTSLAGTLSRNGSFKKSAIQRKLPDNMQLDLDECRKDLSAASWESRLGGLKRFEELTKGMAKAVAGDTKLVEAFIGRLSDINGKVSLEAMDVYLATLPQMARYYGGEACLKAVLNQLLLALSSHLPSKSDEHRALAQKCLTETIKQIDNGALSPAIAAVTRKANVKQKPFMLHIFSKINENQYASKPKQVELGAIPILVEAMKTPPGDAENKKATLDFARSLARLMGEKALMDAIGGGLDPAKRQQIEGMIRR